MKSGQAQEGPETWGSWSNLTPAGRLPHIREGHEEDGGRIQNTLDFFKILPRAHYMFSTIAGEYNHLGRL